MYKSESSINKWDECSYDKWKNNCEIYGKQILTSSSFLLLIFDFDRIILFREERLTIPETSSIIRSHVGH